MAEEPLLSVILTTYTTDRLNDLFEVLDSLNTQSYKNIEIIFVAERAPELMDKFKEYVKTKNIPNAEVFFNHEKPGLSVARSLGAKKSTGGIIAFTDDDVILPPNWAEGMVKIYDDESIIGVTGPAFPLWKDGEADWLPKEFYWIISCTDWSNLHKLTDVRNVWGMNMSFRREAFISSGGFLPDIGGIQGKRLHSEEVELSERIRRITKKRIVFSPDVTVQHKVYKYRLTPRYIAKTSYWIGYTRQGLKRIVRKNKQEENPLRVEYQLLGNILTKLPTDILKTFFRKPSSAFRKASVTIIALSSVAFGYYYYSINDFFNRLSLKRRRI